MSTLKNRFRRFLDEKKANKAITPSDSRFYRGKKDASSKLRTQLDNEYLKSKGFAGFVPEITFTGFDKKNKKLKELRKKDKLLLETKRKKLRNK